MIRRPVAATTKISPSFVDAAGALYLAGVRGAERAPLDQIVARFLREHASLGDNGRAFVVDTAQGMLRARRRLEAAAATLGYEPTRAGLACLFLVGARDVDPADLPIDRRGANALAQAWHATETLPLDVRASLPRWLTDELLRTRGPDADALCLSFAEAPPLALRANRLKAAPADVVDALAEDGHHGSAGTLSPDAVVLERRANVFRTRAFRDGLFEVQDEGSQLVARLCEAGPGMTVVDGCAGAGGKTLHLAALMEGKGTLHAFDVANHRLEALKERARRAGAHNVRVQSLDDPRPRKRLRGEADVVLVDAPCSGTGVLRRNPDTSWQLEPADVERMRAQQAQILDDYAPLVKPGGRLVYATCSVLEAENRGAVDAFLTRHPEFSVVPAAEIFARQGLSVAGIGDVLDVDPLHHGSDGFFGCAFVRSPRSP